METLANVTAFVRTEINELALSTRSFQHTWVSCLWMLGGGGVWYEALAKLLLLNLTPLPWNRNTELEQHWFIVNIWVALETSWQRSLIRTNVAQAAKHVSSCVLGYTHL